MRTAGTVFTTLAAAALLLPVVGLTQSESVFDPHGDPLSGVLRATTTPPSRGQCFQCHPTHQAQNPLPTTPPVLFRENDNGVAYFDEGDGPCHRGRPQNYPLTESDRIPEGFPDAGYFEANVGGTRRVGTQYRGRWPGQVVFANPGMTAAGLYFSPHAMDSDMPRRAGGEGLCLNCHDPHGTANPFDLLVGSYRGIGGSGSAGPPEEYALCFGCHSSIGPAGMNLSGRQIADYYDAGLNGESAGHQIRFNPQVGLSWPAHIRRGDMLSCSDCHNPHGSMGNNGAQPNAFLISDQRPGWSGLTDPRGVAEQARRFCLGCHIPSDGVPGTQEVQGIVMNAISDRGPHRSDSTQSCYFCHGDDYTGPTSNNVHHVRRQGS